jgi:hypothetical protein
MRPNGIELYRPTASRFGDILTPTGLPSKQAKQYLDQIIKWSLHGDADEVKFSSYWTERGKYLESKAIEEYERKKGYKVEKQPFIFNKKYRCGCYPDGKGLVYIEVKCLKKENHFDIVKHGIPLKFKPQIQGTMLITGENTLDFISYFPGEEIYIERVNKEESYSEKLVDELYKFNIALEAEYLRLSGSVKLINGKELF